MRTTWVLANLGNGPVEADSCLDQAVVNITTFIKELGMKDPLVAFTLRSYKHDGIGRYQFDLRRGIRTVDVSMPGVALDEVRGTETVRSTDCWRLYVDGNSWLWSYALGCARDALEDHDGTIEQRRDASEREAAAELERQPRCATCGNARRLVIKEDDLCGVRCLACNPWEP